MGKRERSSDVEEGERYAVVPAGEQRAVFVDTDLDTHFAILVSSLTSVFSLKQEIGVEHFKCFPECGRITIKSLLVKHYDNYYHLPDNMLLKTAFHGVADSWSLFADVWAPVESENHHFFKQLEPSPQIHYGFNRIEAAPQHHHEFKQSRSPPWCRVTPDMSCKKNRWDNERKPIYKVDSIKSKMQLAEISKGEKKSKIDNKKSNMQLSVISKGEKKSKIDVSKTGLQDRKILLPKDGLELNMKQQLNEKTSERGKWSVPRTGDISCVKHLDEHEGPDDTSVVQSSSMVLKDVDNVVKILEGAKLAHQLEDTSMKLAEIPNKGGIDSSEPPAGRRLRKSKNKKKKKSPTVGVEQSHAAISVQGPDMVVKGDASSDKNNDIYKNEQGIKTAEDVSPSQLNKVPELLSQHDPLNLEKEIEEDSALLKSDKTAMGRETNESEQESRRTDEKASELHLDNVPELLSPQHESLNFVEKKKEIVEDVAPMNSKNTAKKRKNNKAKSSGTENQDLSGKSQYDGQEEDDRRHIPEELSLPVDISGQESVETTSANLKKRSRTKKAVPNKDPPASPVKEQPDEQIRAMAAPTIVIQSDKPNKRSQKKQLVPAQDLSSLRVNQHLNEGLMDMDAPERVEQADDIFTETNDAMLKSENTAKRRKSDDTEREIRKTAADVPEMLSPQESLKLVEREKEIKEDVAPLKSDNTTKKRKNNKAKSSSIDTQDLSSKRQNIDPNAEDTGHVHKELFLQDDIIRSEERVETMSAKVRRSSRNKKAGPGKDTPASPVKEQPDEEVKPDEDVKEMAAPVTVIQSDKLKKRSRKKQPVPTKDNSSLLVNQHSDETIMETDALKSVEQADGILMHCDTNDDPLKSENAAKKRKTNDDEREFGRTSEEVPLSHLNSVPKLSQRKPLNLVEREKNTEKDDASLKSENTAIKRKNNKAKSSGAENQDLSSKRQNDDPNTDEETREKAAPISVIQSDNPKKRSQKKQPVSGKDVPSLPLNQHLDESTMKMDAPKRVEQADDVLTDGESTDAENQKEVTLDEDHHAESSQVPRQVSAVSAEVRLLENPQASKHKAKKPNQSSSIDTSSTGHNLRSRGSARTSEIQTSITNQKHDKSIPPLSAKHSGISKEVTDTLPNPTNTSRKTGVSSDGVDDGTESSEASSTSSGSTVRKIHHVVKAKQPPKKMEQDHAGLRRSSRLDTQVALNASAQKKGLLASSGAIFDDGSSSSSEDEDKTDASSSSTTIAPEILSSSDYSEGENKGSPKTIERSKSNASGLKLESILRSSNSYKKAKMVASQSQDESQPVEFVPDSQANM